MLMKLYIIFLIIIANALVNFQRVKSEVLGHDEDDMRNFKIVEDVEETTETLKFHTRTSSKPYKNPTKPDYFINHYRTKYPIKATPNPYVDNPQYPTIPDWHYKTKNPNHIHVKKHPIEEFVDDMNFLITVFSLGLARAINPRDPKLKFQSDLKVYEQLIKKGAVLSADNFINAAGFNFDSIIENLQKIYVSLKQLRGTNKYRQNGAENYIREKRNSENTDKCFRSIQNAVSQCEDLGVSIIKTIKKIKEYNTQRKEE